jgi:capsular polysaccharide biosynthesis protein
VIDPGALTVAEQVRAFAEAEWVISPHGAGLANLAFASPGASVIEMFPPDYVQTCYWKLASAVPGLGYRYLVGVGKPPRNGMMNGAGSDITVDLGALSRMLDALPEGLSSVAAEIHR